MEYTADGRIKCPVAGCLHVFKKAKGLARHTIPHHSLKWSEVKQKYRKLSDMQYEEQCESVRSAWRNNSKKRPTGSVTAPLPKRPRGQTASAAAGSADQLL